MLHLEQLKEQVAGLSQRAARGRQQRRAELSIAQQWLDTAPDSHKLQEQILPSESKEELAIPATDAPINQRTPPPPAPPKRTALVAVDGSQIMPDRHAAALYYLIQVGGLIFRYTGEAPELFGEASLHYEESELLDEAGLLITSQLGMRRTVAEISYLATLVEAASQSPAPDPILALVDGPLLWPYGDRSTEEQRSLPAYLSALDQIREVQGMPVGFTERPGGKPVVNLLQASHLLAITTAALPHEEKLRTLTDHELMESFLAAGERTTWFQRLSPMNDLHGRHSHTIWFCYLNAGEPGYPVIARVEVPAWAAQRPGWSETLHAVLVHQASVLHGNPYVLARAHELALVTSQDKAALDNWIQRQLLEEGLPARPSEKARQKSYLSWQR